MTEQGYVPEISALMEQVAPIAAGTKLKFPRWISTPDGDQGEEWCPDCGYYMWRHLRRHDRKRREDYFLDGGWRTESDGFRFCAGCRIRLDVCLTDYGVEENINHYEECGFSASPRDDAWEINELLEAVHYRSGDSEFQEKRRSDVTAIAERFLAQVNTNG